MQPAALNAVFYEKSYLIQVYYTPTLIIHDLDCFEDFICYENPGQDSIEVNKILEYQSKRSSSSSLAWDGLCDNQVDYLFYPSMNFKKIKVTATFEQWKQHLFLFISMNNEAKWKFHNLNFV